MHNKATLSVFYDGACGVCDTEMAYYKSIADERIRFIDIAAANFEPRAYGRSSDAFQKELHVCDKDGRFYTGVEAFRKLWDTLPSPFYPLLSSFVGLPGVNLAAQSGYAVFARIRHYLPKSMAKSCSLDKPSRN